ncbi:ABC transporter ATP-binding protein [Agromyces sp. C10]|uniref:ABC transporter ATP-binding protein n=1 Tax=Agromyces sp. C10 TaxID=2935077 RepID=UPI00200A6838|nr:ABC transporter ATP-binding protein [Agromyces sp. C10]MCK8610142.1 ABC transporter ATP-binding protein [Agromyces sp. C10]
MANGTAISVSNLSKTYRISHQHRSSRATEAMVEFLRHPFRRAEVEWFDALHALDFEIPEGEAVGIIGRNGAGKSTLLKLLTRITAPTTGRIELNGRVGSLLEVGTGFHPELTGRENIFLNGTLLGMRRREIVRRFEEIVAFAGVERFLDTPVKRYSSGMYVRLAFAVAAHLETEILAIDEVLAVGDAEFQRKSIQKMRDAAADGRTVLFVSHQMHTVLNLCTSAMFLQSGRLAYHGDVETAMHHYRQSYDDHAAAQLEASRRPGNGRLRATSVTMSSPTSRATDRRSVTVRIPDGPAEIGRYYVSCHLTDANGSTVVQCDSRLTGTWLEPDSPHEVTLDIDGLWLRPGRYSIDVFLCSVGVMDAWEGAASFEVLPGLPYPETATEDAYGRSAVLSDFSYSVR